MTPERFKRIDQVFQQALSQPPESRDSFLRQACTGDEDLRREVESLLEHERQAASLVESPIPASIAADQEEESGAGLSGRTLLHYRILEKIGQGGMGIVYRAEDTHLKRSVAIKVLPPEKIADPERKRRFVKEARAASALNHPNIVTIYEIDEADGVDFIAMEYVPGRPLDELIPSQGLAIRETLSYAIQIAEALAAAHEAGIIHRDLKPSNVMVTGKGAVKILDFGLAKLAHPASGEEPSKAQFSLTRPGLILGTVAYMSPEQALGKAVDARSDIFAFGALLYEMVTGYRAFTGNSIALTLTALLHKEPEPVSRIAAGVPAELERIIARCLQKEPDRRFQHCEDVRVELREVREALESRLKTGLAPQPAWRFHWMVPVLVVLIALAVVTGWWLLRPAQELPPVLNCVPLTTYPGLEGAPSFSPDGNQLAFQWNGPNEDNFDVYVKTVGPGEALRLTSDPAFDGDPAWSPDGSLILFRRNTPDGSRILTIPPFGGVERMVYETKYLRKAELSNWARMLAWTPDSKGIVLSEREAESDPNGLFLITLGSGKKRRLTAPPGGFNGDANPAFSPDGRSLSFSRMRDLDAMDLYLLEMTPEYKPMGEPKVLTDRMPIEKRNMFGQSWGAGGKHIIVSMASGSRSYGLWRVPVDDPGSSTRVDAAGFGTVWPAFSQAARRLTFSVYQHVRSAWIVEDPGHGKTRPIAQRVIPSTRREEQCQVSPDGGKIAFSSTRSGAANIWICKSDGSGLLMVTDLEGPWCGSPAWSPDSRSIVFDARPGSQSDIYVVSPEGGPVRQITDHPSEDVMPSFSRDGRWLYFTSNRTGRWEVWKMPSSGGNAVQVTHTGGFYQQESVDGKTLFFAKERYANGIYRMPVEGGEEAIFLPDARIDLFAPTARGYYFWKGRELVFLDSSTQAKRVVTVIQNDPRWFLSAFPDGKRLVYSQVDRNWADLYLIENFR